MFKIIKDNKTLCIRDVLKENPYNHEVITCHDLPEAYKVIRASEHKGLKPEPCTIVPVEE